MDSHPTDWFDAFMPRRGKRQHNKKIVTLETLTEWTNKKAYFCNAGSDGSRYKLWEPFTLKEIMQWIGLFMHNGLCPSPRVEHKFKNSSKNPINDNDFLHKIFGSCADDRFRQFKFFFSCCDPLIPTPSRKSHPNWKVQSLLRHSINVSREAVYIGRVFSIDE